MKRICYYNMLIVLFMVLLSCRDNNINVFDKTADERVAEAIANLKKDLIAPVNGWRVKYRPEPTSGSYYVLMDFNDDNTVHLQTDLSASDGKFFDQTITYRIDNSLGLELIMESYCFFSYLFEQNEASFGAEYQFIYVNKTPDNELVFKSKTDPSDPTILLFEEAKATDTSLLGRALADSLTVISKDLPIFSSSLKITYTNKDLVFYLSIDNFLRTLNIISASKKSNTSTKLAVNFTTPYIIKGDSLVFDSQLKGSFLSNTIIINGLKLNNLTAATLNVCADPTNIHAFQGTTSQNDAITLESTIVNSSGANFAKASNFFNTSIHNIFNNGSSAETDIIADIEGAAAFQLYYNLALSNRSKLTAIGFVIQNKDATITYALWEFTPTLVDNNLVFAFKPDITLFGNQTTDANLDNIKAYISNLTGGDKTFTFQLNSDTFEFYNPCTGWSTVFFVGN